MKPQPAFSTPWITFIFIATLLLSVQSAWAQTEVGSETELRFVYGLPTPGTIVLTNNITLEDCDAGGLDNDPESDVTVTSGENAPEGGWTITQTCEGERIFRMQPFAGETATLTIDHVTLTGGNIEGADLIFADADGGAIFSEGDVVIRNGSLLTGNSASDSGGAIYVINGGNVEVSGSELSENHSESFGGAIWAGVGGNVIITDGSVLNDNEAFSSSGGAIFSNGGGDITITGGSTLNGNSSDVNGGAISIGSNGGGGDVTVRGSSTLNGNRAAHGGAIFIAAGAGGNVTIGDSSILESNHAHADDDGGLGRGEGGAIRVVGSGFVQIEENAQLISNTSENRGGAISAGTGDVIITSALVAGNSVLVSGEDDALGGAIYTEGDVAITNSILNDNFAQAENGEAHGGALYAADGTIIIENGSTFDSNRVMGAGSVFKNGGAIFSEGNVTINNSIFSNNNSEFSGGAIYANDNVIVENNSQFYGNTAENEGGAIYANPEALEGGVTVNNSTFGPPGEESEGNSAVFGGAIFSERNVTVSGSTFARNSADDSGGAIRALGNVVVENNSQFYGNTAEENGGAIRASEDIMVDNSIFAPPDDESELNRARLGGGIYHEGGSATLSNVIFRRNSAISGGGGMYNAGSGPSTFINVVFDRNSTGLDGGGLYIAGGEGTLTNVTLSGNSARDGGGIYNEGASPLTLSNSIVWGNLAFSTIGSGSGDEIFTGEGAVSELFHSLYGNESGDIAGNGTFNPDGNSLTADPFFEDPENGVLRLSNGSPAINTGSNQAYTDAGGNLQGDTDLAGEPRVFAFVGGGIIDRGAYEFQGPALSPLTSVELTHEGEGWRFLTSPVIGETYNEFLESLWTQGPDIPWADHQGGDPNVYRFDPDAYDWDAAFEEIDEEIVPGTGFIIYVFEDDNFDTTIDPEEAFPKTLISAGEWLSLNENFDYTGLDYDSNTEPEGNYFLLGNPHPVPLDFCAFTFANVATSIDIWSPAANGGEGNYENLVCGADDVHIAPFQAFWMRTTDASPSLSIPTGAYLPGSVDGYFKESIAGERTVKPRKDVTNLVLSLHLQSIDETFTNTTRLLLSENGTSGLDETDALKLSPAGLAQRWLSFYSMDEENRPYAFQSLPSEALATGDKITIPLDIETTEVGSFTLNWELPGLRGVGGANYFLRDNRSGQVMELREGGSYQFEIETDVQPFQGSKPWKGLEGAAALIQPSDRFLRHRGSGGQAKGSDGSGDEPRFELLIAAEGVDGLAELGDLPETYELDQNYPNPFNPSTVIRYQLPASSQVRLEVYDMLGRRVATLVDEQVAAGRHRVNFDAGHLSSGVYLYRLTARRTNGANQIFTKKLTLIK